MKILVCIKQILSPESKVWISNSGRWIESYTSAEYRISRWDEYAVEQALLLRAQVPCSTVDVVTSGPERSRSVLKRAMGMGADHAIHLSAPQEEYVSARTTASRLHKVISVKSYDLVLAGVMSEDLGQGIVGPMLAGKLGLPCVTSCVSADMDCERGVMRVEQELESGDVQTHQVDLPALLTIQSGRNKPRYPSLSNILRANKQEVERIEAPDTDLIGNCEELIKLELTPKSRAGVVLEGSIEEKAATVLKIFKDKNLLREEAMSRP